MIAAASHTTLLQVPVLTGAPEALVQRRQLRHKYETNQDVKTWGAWFVLKALSTSGRIGNYIAQCGTLCPVLQCRVSTLRALVHRMARAGLLTVDKRHNLRLISYKKAASLLEIDYTGTEIIPYNYAKQKGNQAFSYLLRLTEIQNAKERQLDGLCYHIAKNPLLHNELVLQLHQRGVAGEELATAQGFQAHLLRLQQQVFVHGSDSYGIIHARRADINRCSATIQASHQYKHITSVSYMKRVLKKYGLATIGKTILESKVRSRLYAPDENGVQRDAYKYSKHKKKTLWILCDDIVPVAA